MFLFTLCVLLCGGATVAQPPVPEFSRFGRIIAVHVDGYFHPVVDPGGQKFKDGIKRAGIMNDSQLVTAGRAAMDQLTKEFGIDTSFVTDDNLLHNPAKVEDATGTYRFETGMMGPDTNIHVLSEVVRTKAGKVAGRKPERPVRLSFFYMKLVCLKETCPVSGGTVVMSTEATVQWLVAEQSDLDSGWNYVFQVQGTEMFFTHSPIHPKLIEGILKDKVTSAVFGDGMICGVMQLDRKNARMDVQPPRPRIKLHYLVIFPELLEALPDWPSPQASSATPTDCYGGHWSCLPALSPDTDPTRLHGRELTIYADGYFSLEADTNVYRRILATAGLKTDQQVIQWGRDALQFMKDEFGIETDSYVTDNVILHNPPTAMDPAGKWHVYVGVMDPTYSNIQIVSEALTDKNGKSVVRVPADRVVVSVAFIWASCWAQSCELKSGATVPENAKAIVQWLVTEGSGDIQVAYESRTFDMFKPRAYLNPTISGGIVKERANSTQHGECETNGYMGFDTGFDKYGNVTTVKLTMCYIVTCKELLDKLPPSTGPVTYFSSVAMVICLAVNHLRYL